MRLELDLSLPADSRLLAGTRRVVAVYLQEFGTPTAVVDDVILAIDEACTNVVQHAYPDGQPGSYLLRADVERERILIEVVDEGIGFDTMGKPRPAHPDGEMAQNGRGLEVMRRLMTTVEVESPTQTGGTRLRLVRLLPTVSE